MNKREQIKNLYGIETLDDVVFLEPDYYDEAIIGVGYSISKVGLVYSERRILSFLVERDKMDPDEAMEWFQFNIAGAHFGEGSPIFVDVEALE